MLRIDRTVRFGEDFLRFRIDQESGLIPQTQTLLHFDQSAEIREVYFNLLHADRNAQFLAVFLTLLHIDPNARFHRVNLALHFDPSAQFRGERPGRFFSKQIYRLYCNSGTLEFGSRKHWTEEQFRYLLTQQHRDPVPLTTDETSGKTWWWFRNDFFWEDYSARMGHKKQRAVSIIKKEVKAAYLAGSGITSGIQIGIYRFQCQPDEGKRQQGEFLTEKQYLSLLAQQQETPARVLSDSGSGKTWWTFQNKTYWADSDLKEDEVKIIFFEGPRNDKGISKESIYHFHTEQGNRGLQSDKFWTEEQYLTLLTRQRKDPVQLFNCNDRTWWMFQDVIYWEDADLSEVEVNLLFFEGVRNPDGISMENEYHFCHRRRGWEVIHSDQFWTEKQFQALFARQRDVPVRLRNDNSVTWWMFRDKIYWTESVKTEEEVRMLFAKRSPSPDGNFRKTSYRFYCGLDPSEAKLQGYWTEEQYRFLLARQQVDPIRIRSELESGRTWWMYQGRFYWEDFSTGWPEETKELEMQEHFYNGSQTSDGISSKIYRSQCKQGGRKLQSRIFWTEDQYRLLLATQKEDPVQVLSNRESGRTWWMFRDKFYWEDDDLKQIEVKALLLQRIRKKEREIERAIRLMKEGD